MIPSPERAPQNPWYSFVLPFQGKCRVARQTQGVALGCHVVALSVRRNAKHGTHYKCRGTAFLIAWLLLAGLRVSAVTLVLTPGAPVPQPYDIYNFAGADMDMHNVYAAGNAPATNGSANDAYTYVMHYYNPQQGQTFTTGNSADGYWLTDIWVRHVGYYNNVIDPSSTDGTWWKMAAGSALTLRVTNPSQAGHASFVLHSETYTTTGNEGWDTSYYGAYSVNGDSMWLHFTLASPVWLTTNTIYGFDLTASIADSNDARFEWLGNETNVYSGGTAYTGSTGGTPDNTLKPLVGERVFLLQLTPAAHLQLSARPVLPGQVQLSWPTNYPGFMLLGTTNVSGPWNYAGPVVSSLNGTNFATDSSCGNQMFYRLQYLGGARPIPVTSWLTNTDGLTFQMNPGTLRLQVYSPSVIRVAYSLTNSVPTNSLAVTASPMTSGWNVQVSGNVVSLTTSALQVRVNRGTGAVGFYDTNGATILSEPAAGGKSLFPTTVPSVSPTTVLGSTLQSQQQFVISSNEAIFGLGEHPAGIMNYRGTSVHLQNENPSQGATPVLVSSLGYGIFWDNPAISDVSVAQSSPTNLTWTSEAASAVDYYFMYGPGLDAVIGGYRNLTGNPPMFGKWACGLWQCRNYYTNQTEILTVASTYRSMGIPLDCVIQDWFYWLPHPFGSDLFDTSRYPNVPLMMQTLHNENAHLIISVWPRFDLNIYNANALAAVNGLYTNIVNSTWPPGVDQWYDPFNAAARQVFWQEIATNLFNLGIDGWWFDVSEPELSGNWGEYRSFNTADGPGYSVFNAFPLMHSTTAYVGQRSLTSSKRVFILTRSAWAGQQRNASVTWSGDINGDFPTLAEQIPAGLNFSISGIPYWTTDTGGFNDNGTTNTAYDEVFTRWFQFSTFCPLLRIHGNNNKALYYFPSPYYSVLTNYDQLRYHLVPYIYSVSWMVSQGGYTMMRPLVMDFQQDTNVFNIPDQYMFGPALMACPVTVAGATSRNVYLPSGATWYDFWTGQTYAGGQTLAASAPLQTMPLYVPAGSVLPYGTNIQYAVQTNDPVELRIYRGASGSFTLYEDENDNYDYESGSYATIPITWNDSSQTLTIGARQGSFPGMLTNRTFLIVWVSAGHGAGTGMTPTPDAIIHYSGSAVQIPGG
jgi:alpha-D-xyloside xylohydrolase